MTVEKPDSSKRLQDREKAMRPQGDAAHIPDDLAESALDEASLVEDVAGMLFGEKQDLGQAKHSQAIMVPDRKGTISERSSIHDWTF